MIYSSCCFPFFQSNMNHLYSWAWAVQFSFETVILCVKASPFTHIWMLNSVFQSHFLGIIFKLFKKKKRERSTKDFWRILHQYALKMTKLRLFRKYSVNEKSLWKELQNEIRFLFLGELVALICPSSVWKRYPLIATVGNLTNSCHD